MELESETAAVVVVEAVVAVVVAIVVVAVIVVAAEGDFVHPEKEEEIKMKEVIEQSNTSTAQPTQRTQSQP